MSLAAMPLRAYSPQECLVKESEEDMTVYVGETI